MFTNLLGVPAEADRAIRSNLFFRTSKKVFPLLSLTQTQQK